MNLISILRWFFYLVLFTSNSEGSYSHSRQMDSRFTSNSKLVPNAQNSTDKLYGTWSEWSSCSSTCDLGISTRTRTCLKSSYNAKGVSIPLCHGDYEEHRMCNLRTCPENTVSIRELQCLQYNNRIIAGVFVKSWVPVNEGPNPCELRCEAKSAKLVYGFGKVSDGTPCPFGVCLDGRCLTVGCDERLGSEVMLDMCGVCGGRNASCVHYKDVYQGQPSSNSGQRSTYHEVVVIPIGARNLVIRQSVGKNILALQDRSKGIIFNGEQHLKKFGGHFEIAGTVVNFLKTDNITEELLSKGPVTQDLYVLVLLRSRNPGIYYEYWLPKQSHNPGHNQYTIRPTLRSRYPFTVATTTKPHSHQIPVFSPRPVTEIRSHHPTKPAFAYGYGEKPYKGQDAPVFRHISSTTASPRYDSTYEPLVTPQYHIHTPEPDTYVQIAKDKIPERYPVPKNNVPRAYKSMYLTPKPDLGYYRTFRNVSNQNLPKVLDYEKDIPVLTQRDSSSSNGRAWHENVISNSLYKKNEPELVIPKSPNPDQKSIGVQKRIDKPERIFLTNGRLKYSFETKSTDEVYANSSGHYTPEPLAIAVLPDSGNTTLRKKTKKKDGSSHPQKPRLTRAGLCEPCQRSRDQTKHFCQSDFVVRAHVIGFEFLHGETRYELEVKQSFKNTLSLLSKEYVWSPDTCRCPKLRPGKEYIIMGRSDNNYRKRESRLLVDKTCFVRTFNLKYVRRLQKLRKDQTRKCRKVS